MAAHTARSPGPPRGQTGFTSAWPGPGWPPLVRVRIVFPKGSALQWPDIVAGPGRQRW